MILYLSGIQPSRAELRPEKIVKTVYGILTEGLEFSFFRLDEDRLYISKLFAADFEDESKDYRSILFLRPQSSPPPTLSRPKHYQAQL